MKIVKELKPTYFDDFKCIGSKCEDTCCAGWNIDIDKKSFKKYRKETNPNLKEMLKKNVSRNRQSKSNYDYGRFKMDEQNKCSMLNEENLCTIQLSVGEEALCNTCTVYPREVSSINNTLEKNLDTSCPEAARLILLNRNGIDFVEVEPELPKYYFAQHSQSDVVNSYFWTNRMFMISALQHRAHPIEVRLMVIGLYVKKLESLDPAERFFQAQPLSNQFSSYLDNPNILELTSQVNPNYDYQKAFTKFFIIDLKTNSERFDNLTKRTFSSVDFKDATIKFKEKIITTKKYYNSNTNIQFALENYLVSICFSKYNESSTNIFEFFSILIINFSLIRLLLIGNENISNLNNEKIVEIIQTFSKACLHTSTYVPTALDIITEVGHSNAVQALNLVNI